ncbi:prolyl oligopeptidase family serine peptidase [Aliikangiella coralliicola]|uniref:Prolyl oligopeptidase family serine peptidase n=1 Tax=Aliikangiella coralliicola TaxID=2592383 RepID=A0A545U4P1_9GAMM|nr:prolyl oligopeptidase family serine peptidase [Aliikangiella coralliicola]TQV84445.1 prolyl oligopeptidase family serine peptidase [Aliikangiella coralliicola]
MNKLFALFLFLLSINVFAADFIATSKLFSSREHSAISISPGGEFALGRRNSPNHTIIFVRDIRTGEEIKLIALDKDELRRVSQVNWVDENTVFIKYRLRYSHLKIMEIFSDEAGIRFNEYSPKVDGHLVDPMLEVKGEFIFAHLLDGESDYRVVQANRELLMSGELANLRKLNKGVDNAVGFVTDGFHRLRLALIKEDEKMSLNYRHLKDNKWIKIYQRKHHRDVFRPIQALDNDEIVVLSNIKRDKTAVIRYNVNQPEKAQVLFESDIYDVIGATVDHTSGKLASVTYVEHGLPTTQYLMEESSDSQSKIAQKFPQQKVYLVSESLDSNHSIYFMINSDFPGAYYYYDKQKRESIRLFDIRPQFAELKFQKTLTKRIKTPEGHFVEIFLTLPNTSKTKYPLVVMPHGGPIGVSDTNSFNLEVQYLANRGFAVLRVNFRGSAGYGKSFQQAGVSQWGKGIEKDIDSAVNYAIEHYQIDENKMCIIGGSYGGYSSLMSVINYPGKYQCAVSYFGVTDLTLLYSASNIYQSEKIREAITNTVGDILSHFEEAKRNSPVYRAAEINVPIMIMAGGKDRIAHPEHSYRLSYVLDKLGVDHEFVLYPDSTHGHPTWNGERHQFIKIVEFLREHLGIVREYRGEDRRQMGDDMHFMSFQYRATGVAKADRDKVISYTQQAVELGNIDAAYRLARFYERGIGFEQNYKKAFDWYLYAAKANHLESLLKVAKIYQYGLLGITRNWPLAFENYEKAFHMNSYAGGREMAYMLICKGEKQKAIELVSSLEGKADDYPAWAISELEKVHKEKLTCH